MKLTTAGAQGSVLWTPVTGLQTDHWGNIYASPRTTTTYTALLTTTLGCQVSRSFTITVVSRLPLIVNRLLLPNSAGPNNRFYIMDLGQYPVNRLQVYDFFGRPVYAQDNYNNNWNGSVNGRLLPDGIYIFTLKVGNAIIATGTVTILH